MESILYARLPGDIVVVRVRGKGNHLNSIALREIFKQTSPGDRCAAYVFDLEQCTTMDSTFMGTLASMALRQRRALGRKAAAVNANPHVRELLSTLGLKFILDMRDHPPGERKPEDATFAPAAPPEIDKIERIAMMIEAHERLIDVDGGNEVKFTGVLQSLRESLDRAREE